MVNCSVRGCKNRTEQKNEAITYHRFPKDNSLKKLWINATGRANWIPTKHSRMCSVHFQIECFDKRVKLTKLRLGSVPKLLIHEGIADETVISGPSTSGQRDDVVKAQSSNFQCNQMNVIIETVLPSGDQESVGDLIEMEKPSTSKALTKSGVTAKATEDPIDCTPRKRKLFKKLRLKSETADRRKKRIAVLKTRNWRLQKKNADLVYILEHLKTKSLLDQENIDILSAIDPMKKDLLKNMVGVSKKRRYSPELRQFALTLHFISPRAYSYVRDIFNTGLPHPRTLTRWYQCVNGEPGFTKEAFDAIRMLTKKSENKQLYGAICFDEMAIRKSVEFDGKNYVGLVNFGDINENELLPVAKEVLVFMLTCINGSWKLPIGYFLINGIKADQKASLVRQALDLVEEAGVRVISVTFDGCPTNFAMCKVLGCSFEKGKMDTVFQHNNKHIAVFPDPSHMLKLVRNSLGDKKVFRDKENNPIDWSFVSKLVEIQECEEFHMANKVKKANIYFRKQIMKVKLAAQTFSDSLANAIEHCNYDLGIDEFKNSGATVNFIRNINNLFDILNSRNLNAKGFKKPLKQENFLEHKQFLDEMFDYISSIKLDYDLPLTDSQRKTGFLGFQICIKSLIFLFNTFVKNNADMYFLCSYKLSQDHIEYFFSSIRARGGFNNNPTARQFKAAYKRLLVHGELKHITTGNCIPLSDVNILTNTKPDLLLNISTDRKNLVEYDSNNGSPEQSLNYIVIDNDHDYLADPTRLTEFAKSVITYIAGFVVRSVEKKLKCQHCISVLRQDKFSSLQARKDKGGLIYPSNDVIFICRLAEKVFKKNRSFNVQYPLESLVQECLKECLQLDLFNKISQHFLEQDFVNNHYGLLIKTICMCYLKTRIHYVTKNQLKDDDKVRNMYTKLILFKGQ